MAKLTSLMEHMMISPETVRTMRRVAADFALGVLVFAIVAGSFAISEGQAAGGHVVKPDWVTTVAFAADHPSMPRLGHWPVSATILLALTFGALTAFNLSLARHVRTVAVQPAQSHGQSADH
jgi:hypothetical protein